MIKRFKGTKTFKNYKELCSFLGIEPSTRGALREQQLTDLHKSYDIIKYDSGRYSVTYITQEERDYRAGISGGWIQTIDGIEVNLKSPQCYQHTGIENYILYCALNAQTETMRDFQILCFHSCSYYYKLLNKEYFGTDGLDSLQKQYDTFILTKADEFIGGRLDDRVDYLLKKFEESGYIKTERFYRLSNDTTASIETIKPYVDGALNQLGYRNEYFACRSKSSREQYFQKRNELFQKGENTKLEIVRKELHISPVLTSTNDKYPNLSKEQQAEILNKFFNVFRAKLLYDLKTPNKIKAAEIPSKFKIGIQEKSVEQIISEVIEKYCTCKTASNDTLLNLKQFNYYAVSGLEDNINSENTSEKSEITGNDTD